MTRTEDRYALDYASFVRARLFKQSRYYCENVFSKDKKNIEY